MLVGVWCSNHKPPINEYLKPFIQETQILYEKGFNYKFRGKIYNEKCKVLIGIFDSIARASVQLTTQFNGYYGYGLCLHPGKQVKKGKGTVRVYPLNSRGYPYGKGLRSHAHFLEYVDTLMFGIRGRSILIDLPGFDIVKGIPPDWMHAVLLGICRQVC